MFSPLPVDVQTLCLRGSTACSTESAPMASAAPDSAKSSGGQEQKQVEASRLAYFNNFQHLFSL